MHEINYYADLAQKILGGDTAYYHDKKMIANIFQAKKGKDFDKIKLRLTIIDSYYSTQMNKRFFGIEEIAEKILAVSKNDEELINKFKNFIENPNEEMKILELFKTKFGCKKTGEQSGVAPSIISKYAYFLTNFKFPIYDNLAKEGYKLICKKYPNLELRKLNDNNIVNYFENISNLNKITNINNYDKLDNLLWLYGKLTQGSFSLILHKKDYLKLVNNIKFKSEKSKDVDNKIRNYIIENLNSSKLLDIFKKETIEFMKFCYN